MRRVITALLRHPVSMAIKRRLRDLRWSMRGDLGERPPVPKTVRTILFVCLGNICRSPFAARLAAQKLAARGTHDVECFSAGIRATQAGRSPREAHDASRNYGVALDTHVPQPLSREMVEGADAIVVMEPRQATQLLGMFPQSEGRIWLLAPFDAEARGAFERSNIADPFGQEAAVFDRCFARIDRALERFLQPIVTR